jgi:hypothetical protein
MIPRNTLTSPLFGVTISTIRHHFNRVLRLVEQEGKLFCHVF